MKKSLLRAALLLAICTGFATAQTSAELDTYTATTGDLLAKAWTYKHVEAAGTLHQVHVFSVIWGDVTPATSTLTVTPCNAIGCSHPMTNTLIANEVITVTGAWTYYKVAVTWTGATDSSALSVAGMD